jgi:hypothetical protein
MIDVAYLTAVSVLPVSALIVAVVVYLIARADRSESTSQRTKHS